MQETNLKKAYDLLEAETDPDKVSALFPEEKAEIRKISSIISSLTAGKDAIEAPREVLQKILSKKNEFSSEAIGRSSWLDAFDNLINLNLMNKKLKIISALGVVVIILVGVIAFQSGKDASEVANNPKTKPAAETKLATTTPVIGDKTIDESINNSLNDVLNENDFDSELVDVELALADEESLNDINNLTNDDEL